MIASYIPEKLVPVPSANVMFESNVQILVRLPKPEPGGGKGLHILWIVADCKPIHPKSVAGWIGLVPEMQGNCSVEAMIKHKPTDRLLDSRIGR
jgi:hypothetical protein